MFNNYKSITDYDCEKVRLSKEHKKYLDALIINQTLILPRSIATVLTEYGLARVISSDNTTIELKITEFGKVYKEYQKDKIKDYILSGIKEWITIAVSVTALIISILNK